MTAVMAADRESSVRVRADGFGESGNLEMPDLENRVQRGPCRIRMAEFLGANTDCFRDRTQSHEGTSEMGVEYEVS